MPFPEQLEALDTIAAAAVIAERQTGCPAELSAAQCILESSWLTVCPGNNCFGIKATDDSATYQFTREFRNGQWVTEKDAFEAYPDLATCFIVHANLLQAGVYSTAWNWYQQGAAVPVSKDLALDGYIRGVAQHYATDPQYAQEVLTLAHGPHVTEAIAKARAAGGVAA